jgi:putative acyl-CoA dehydrogenase
MEAVTDNGQDKDPDNGLDKNPAYATHEVQNQARELANYNAFTSDAALQDALQLYGGASGGDWARNELKACGALIGSAQVQQLARQADRHKPELRTHDRFGNRIDEVEFHPAWHELMQRLRISGYHSLPWTTDKPGAHGVRAVTSYLWNQAENGVCCPGAMTFASIAALKVDADLLARYQEKILSLAYDPRPVPPPQKQSLGVGMAMTEKQCGSDLRQTATAATPSGTRTGPGAAYELIGHKWFFSVPTSDLFLTLARTTKGVSCFLAQGWLDDGSRNRLAIQRLKDKCGNRSNASAEVEFRGLRAVMLGEEGRGIPTILEMGHLTRLECAIASAGIIRQATVQAINHAQTRHSFQRVLADQPMMTNVLADLALESEGHMWLAMRSAAAFDDGSEKSLSRIMTPIAKYWTCKRTPMVVAEALECHGGNGFIEDHLMARLYREAPLNGVWEGAGNVICLDVIRALARHPESAAALLDEIALSRRVHPALDASLADLTQKLFKPATLETQARRLVEQLAVTLIASLLLRNAPNHVSEAFCTTRLGGDYGAALGTLPPGTAFAAIVERAAVRL